MFTPVSEFVVPKGTYPNSHESRPAPVVTGARAVTCFTPGTAITTLKGKRFVEELRQGDRILTRDRGFQPLIWSGRRDLSAARPIRDASLCPIRIKAGALGPSLPDRDLVVSPGHRLLTTSPALVAPLGETECLVEAHDLLGNPGIEGAPVRSLTYIHLLFEQHEVILSDNAWSESYHISEEEAGHHAQPLARKCVGHRVLRLAG